MEQAYKLSSKHLHFIRPHNGKGKAVPIQAVIAYMGSWIIAQLVLNSGTRMRLVVNFTPQLLYLRGKNSSSY